MKIFKKLNLFISFFLIALIRLYQLILSPILGQNCRFLPTCSQYAIESIKTHGLTRGLMYSTKRICACHPFAKSKYDPVKKINFHE